MGAATPSAPATSGVAAKATSFEQAPVEVSGKSLPAFKDSVDDPAVGKTMPTVTGVSVFDGSPVVIKPTGKPQLIVFVAHWCPHCQAEVPRLVALAKEGKFKGADITAVATGTLASAPNYPPSAWLKRVGWPFPVMADSTTTAAAQAFGLTAYPTFVLVNGDGKVMGRSAGEATDADVTANIKALVAGEKLPLLESGASTSGELTAAGRVRRRSRRRPRGRVGDDRCESPSCA